MNGRLIGLINTPTVKVASGMWTMREAALSTRNGTWPLSDLIAPYYAWEANFGVTTVGADGVTDDLLPVDGHKVRSWVSTNGLLALTQSTAASMPTYRIGDARSRPYIEMDSTGQTKTSITQYLESRAMPALWDNRDQLSMGVAMYDPGTYVGYRNDNYCGFNFGWSDTPTLLNMVNYPAFRYGGDQVTGGKFTDLAATAQLGAKSTFFCTFSTTSTSQLAAEANVSKGRIYFNGLLNSENLVTTTTRTTTTGLNQFAVGRTSDPPSSAVKKYCGVYMYTQELTATQVLSIHNYISARWFPLTAPTAVEDVL